MRQERTAKEEQEQQEQEQEEEHVEQEHVEQEQEQEEEHVEQEHVEQEQEQEPDRRDVSVVVVLPDVRLVVHPEPQVSTLRSYTTPGWYVDSGSGGECTWSFTTYSFPAASSSRLLWLSSSMKSLNSSQSTCSRRHSTVLP